MSRSGRPDRRKPRIPRHAFWKGAGTGILVVIPLVAFGVWVSARVGVTKHDDGLIACLRMTVIFAGIAAVLTAGGVGRLAAEASAAGGRPRAVLVAARAMAPGGAALTMIAAIPHGGLPMTPAGWGALAVLGAIVGAGGGVVIGMACAGELPTLQELGVWPPTEWPVPIPWPFDDEDDADEVAREREKAEAKAALEAAKAKLALMARAKSEPPRAKSEPPRAKSEPPATVKEEPSSNVVTDEVPEPKPDATPDENVP